MLKNICVKLVAPKARPSRLSSGHCGSYSEEAKNRAVAAYCAEPDKPVSQIAEEHGVSRLTIYAQKHKCEGKGYNIPAMGKRKKKQEASPCPPMGEPETERETELMAELAEARKQLEEKDRQLYEMTLRNAVLENLAELKKARAST